jgi:acylphosphatase
MLVLSSWLFHVLQSKALELGVTGWVRNRRDGRVEVTAEGYPEDLEALLKWLHTGRSADD